jgi:Trypsin-co-occurring domain 1
MSQSVLVDAGGVEFYVEVDDPGAGTVGLDDRFDLDGVRDTVTAIAGKLGEAWDRVKPAEATVELGLKLTAKTGKLTALVVEGGGDATLSVKLTWKSPVAVLGSS